MPIEFPCPGCQNLLRVADSAAGKQARCPDCGAVSPIPHTGPPFSSGGVPASFSPPQPAEPDADTWSTGNWSTGTSLSAPNQYAQNAEPNPFSAPSSDYAAHQWSREEIRSQVSAPAICLMVTGGISLAITAMFGALMMIGAFADATKPNNDNPGDTILGFVIVAAMIMIPLARSALIIYGAVQMKKLQRYPFAMTAAILALLPVCSCLIELAFGIWALVILCRSQVREEFYSPSR